MSSNQPASLLREDKVTQKNSGSAYTCHRVNDGNVRTAGDMIKLLELDTLVSYAVHLHRGVPSDENTKDIQIYTYSMVLGTTEYSPAKKRSADE